LIKNQFLVANLVFDRGMHDPQRDAAMQSEPVQ